MLLIYECTVLDFLIFVLEAAISTDKSVSHNMLTTQQQPLTSRVHRVSPLHHFL